MSYSNHDNDLKNRHIQNWQGFWKMLGRRDVCPTCKVSENTCAFSQRFSVMERFCKNSFSFIRKKLLCRCLIESWITTPRPVDVPVSLILLWTCPLMSNLKVSHKTASNKIEQVTLSSPEKACWFPLDTGRKLNVHKTGRFLNVLCTFNLRPVSRWGGGG